MTSCLALLDARNSPAVGNIPQDEAGKDGVVYDPHSDPGIYMQKDRPVAWRMVCRDRVEERGRGKGCFLRTEDTEISRSKWAKITNRQGRDCERKLGQDLSDI